MMSVVHAWIDSHPLANRHCSHIGSYFDHGPAELMAHDEWQSGPGVGILLSVLWEQDWTIDILMDVCAAYTAVSDFEADFIGPALSGISCQS